MSEEAKKKVEKTPKQKHNELIERSVDLYAKALELFKKTHLLHEKIEREVREMQKDNIGLYQLMNKKFAEQGKVVSKIASIAATSEDTLLNVLLAIRQNEYLQAWYPAQHNVPEMKVVGPHPAKLKVEEC